MLAMTVLFITICIGALTALYCIAQALDPPIRFSGD
jgi:hypothetical protein